jgi:capsular polysaccharide biosynthesis protein
LRSFFAPNIREREDAKRVYISRLNSSRSPNFEKELVYRLREEGWEILNTESMSLIDQVNTISSASTLCGVHGAGLAGMIWMTSGSQVIELDLGVLFLASLV